MKNYLLPLLLTSCCLGSAPAAVLFEDSSNVVPAANFWYNDKDDSDTSLLAFTEATDIQLADGSLGVQALNQWDNVTDLIAIDVSQARLDSHMLYVELANHDGRVTIEAEVAFDAPIVGFLADGVLFGQEDPAFAPDPTHTQPADKPNVWSLEEEASWTPLDAVTVLSPTRIRISFTNRSATDPLRVVTLRSGSVSPTLAEYTDIADTAPGAPSGLEAVVNP